MAFVLFYDMHSGGKTKEKPYEKIYIEAKDENEAKVIFHNKFGHNPERVTCTCCGEDYSVSSSKTLKQASAYHRGCQVGKKKVGKGYKWQYFEKDEQLPEGWKWDGKGYGKYMTIEEYIKEPNVLVICAKDIKEEERHGEVPTEGWM